MQVEVINSRSDQRFILEKRGESSVSSDYLPEELLVQIFSFLDEIDIIKASLVSRDWRRILETNSLRQESLAKRMSELYTSELIGVFGGPREFIKVPTLHKAVAYQRAFVVPGEVKAPVMRISRYAFLTFKYSIVEKANSQRQVKEETEILFLRRGIQKLWISQIPGPSWIGDYAKNGPVHQLNLMRRLIRGEECEVCDKSNKKFKIKLLPSQSVEQKMEKKTVGK